MVSPTDEKDDDTPNVHTDEDDQVVENVYTSGTANDAVVAN